MADWWVAAYKPEIGWASYIYPMGWVIQLTPCVQLKMVDLSSAVNVYNGKLEVGIYDFYFAVDSNVDGNPDGTWIDTVKVTVQ